MGRRHLTQPSKLSGAAWAARRQNLPRGIWGVGSLRPVLRHLGIPSPDPRTRRYRSRISRYQNCPGRTRGAARKRSLPRQTQRGLSSLGGIHQSARCAQNVYVKFGGLGQIINGLGFNEQAEPPSSEMLATAMRPYIETCIEAFGADRSMFASNFPVNKVSYSYPIFWNACKLITKGASSAEKTALFSGTAARFYRLNAMG
jgi:hypothetical protein